MIFRLLFFLSFSKKIHTLYQILTKYMQHTDNLETKKKMKGTKNGVEKSLKKKEGKKSEEW